MLVKVNTSLAGADFTYNFGDEVDADEFAAAVGNGWENLCDPIAASEPVIEQAVLPLAPEKAVVEAPVETAVIQPSPERRGRRK